MTTQLSMPPLEANEIYIGAIGNAKGDLYHLILLPGDNDDANWQAQMDWAKSIGGDLPSRIEQAMLFAHFKDQFQEDAYWSNTTHHREDGWAWFQGFYYGYQSNDHKYVTCRARAVRRLPI